MNIHLDKEVELTIYTSCILSLLAEIGGIFIIINLMFSFIASKFSTFLYNSTFIERFFLKKEKIDEY